MPSGEHHAPDVAIVASVSADELRFESQPDVRTRFRGTGERDSHQTTTRRNIDSPVKARRTYRRVFVATRISSRLAEPAAYPPDNGSVAVRTVPPLGGRA